MKLRTRTMKIFLNMAPKCEYWKYFEKIDNSRARCRTCAKIIKTSGNTSNLKAHVNKMHSTLVSSSSVSLHRPADSAGTLIFRAPSAPQPCTSSASSSRPETVEVCETESECESESSVSSAGSTKKVRHHQPTLSSSFRNISAYAETGAKGVQLTNAILYMICKDSQPFQIVENEGFLNLMKIKWGIHKEKVQAVVTDAGANIIKAVELVFGKKYHIPCFAHMLNLVAQKSIEKTDGLLELINSVKKIVTWFKQSVIASDELRKESDLKLIQDVSTRWNSTFYMIERFLKLRPAINTIINCHASAPPMLTAREIIDLNDICEILRPIEVATREICGEKYVTCSKVIPLTRLLNTKISTLTPKQNMAENLKINVLAEINKRLLPTEYVNTLAVATLLDPRFKNIHFQNALACSKAISRVKDLLSAIDKQAEDEQATEEVIVTQKNDANDLWSDHYRLVNEKNSLSMVQSESESTSMPFELNSFLKSPLVDLKEDPLELWNRVLGCSYPMLKKIAIKHLTCAATSTSSERLFSKAGQTLYQQRNRLKGKLLSKLLILQSIDKKLWDF
uniref:SFRICE_015994 n=1 Tax=Spodoptera frugiperda TaxID=7108 RepID=A0A2H1X2G2_SPOFR